MGVILLAYLFNQILKKRALRKEHTGEKQQHTTGRDDIVVNAGAPAGPVEVVETIAPVNGTLPVSVRPTARFQ
jgi:hypothetical protein